MGITELFEVGFFTALWNWSNPILTAIIYGGIVLGFAIQFIIQLKSHRIFPCWIMIILCLLGVVVWECATQAITGWDRLAVLIFYGLTWCLLIGAVIAKITVFFVKKRKAVTSKTSDIK